jgi:hypothetical protein
LYKAEYLKVSLKKTILKFESRIRNGSSFRIKSIAEFAMIGPN